MGWPCWDSSLHASEVSSYPAVSENYIQRFTRFHLYDLHLLYDDNGIEVYIIMGEVDVSNCYSIDTFINYIKGRPRNST